MPFPCVRRTILLAALCIGCAHAPRPSEGPAPRLLAEAWQHSAAERHALYYQGFWLARLRLDEELAAQTTQAQQLPPAIVVDIDETILDNSPYLSAVSREGGQLWVTHWRAWVDAAIAEATPGSVDFLTYAESRGVRVFYVTSRGAADRDGTARNLARLGFPRADQETLLLRERDSSKEPRRRAIGQRFRILLLLGDNLGDFAADFESGSPADRAMAGAAQRERFGHRYIVFPNPCYGTWENAIYGYKRVTPTQQRALLSKTLRFFP